MHLYHPRQNSYQGIFESRVSELDQQAVDVYIKYLVNIAAPQFTSF